MKYLSILTLCTLLSLSACSQQPEPIVYGKDNCHYCQMKIMDPKFGSEVITEKGRLYKFDSSECMLRYLSESDDEHQTLLVTDYTKPKSLIDATTAYYLVSKNMPSPMGAYLNAFSSKTEAESKKENNGGTVYSWDGIRSEYK